MKLTLIGHNDLYAVEQLQLSLFPDSTFLCTAFFVKSIYSIS